MILKKRKVFFLIAVMMILNSHIVFSQDSEYDKRDKINSSELTQTDLIEALDLAGIQIHKFNIGIFDTIYEITFFK